MSTELFAVTYTPPWLGRVCYLMHWRGDDKEPTLTGFKSAKLFHSKGEADAVAKKWDETESGTPENPLPPAVVLDINAMPEPEGFAEANPCDADHIPDAGMEVKVLYRDGSTSLVSGDFLRNELLAGNWIHPAGFCRWAYTGDISYDHPDFLKKFAKS